MPISVPTPIATNDQLQEHGIVRRISWRLLPFLFFLYLIASIDRSNVAFAALQMNHDLGFSAAVYGFGAGFFPGMIFYLGQWFPAAERARAVSRFMMAIPVAGVLGGVMAGGLLGLDGKLGLAGWQWLFLLEGLPSVILGVAVWVVLPDRPEHASWLSEAERATLLRTLDAERAAVEMSHGRKSVSQALVHPLLWQLATLWFLVAVCAYTFGFWAPQILKATAHLRNTQVGFTSALLTLISVPFMLVWAAHSDRRNERRLHVALGGVILCLGFLGTALLHNPRLAIAAQAVVWIGINMQNGPFWSLPGSLLSGIALVSSVAFMGGFLGPNIFGPISDASHGYAAGLVLLAVLALVASGIALTLRSASPRGGSEHSRT